MRKRKKVELQPLTRHEELPVGADSLAIRSLIALFILQILSNGEKCTHEISMIFDKIKEVFPFSSSIYFVIFYMKDYEYLLSERRPVPGENRIRIYYTLTDKGRERLEACKKNYQQALQGLHYAMENVDALAASIHIE